MEQPFNSAVVGCGAIHSAHVKAIFDCNNSHLYAVCDIDADIAREVAEQNSCKCFTEYNQLLLDSNIDVIHLCTPHYLHAPMAIKAMQAGKHVLCEKPMATSLEDCIEMEQISFKSGKMLGICFQNRYNPATEYILKILESKQLGAMRGGKAFVTWNRNEEYYANSPWRGKLLTEGGGCLMNQAIHTLDLFQRFLCAGGNEIAGISANVSTKRHPGIIDVEDTADACLFLKNGVRGLFYASNAYVVDEPVSIELICESGCIRMYGSTVVIQTESSTNTLNFDNPASYGKSYWGSGHGALINHYYDCLKHSRAFPVDAAQAMKVIKIIAGIYKSSKNNASLMML